MIAERYESQLTPTRPSLNWLPGMRGKATLVGLLLGVLMAVLLSPGSLLLQGGLVLIGLAVVFVVVPLATAVGRTTDRTPDWGMALIGQGVGLVGIAALFFASLISF